MRKLTFVIQFRKDMDRKEAQRYWREVHGPIAAKVPGLAKYVQNHATAGLQGELPFDGFAELWCDSQEALDAAMASPEWQAMMADAAKFVDLPTVQAAMVDEISVV